VGVGRVAKIAGIAAAEHLAFGFEVQVDFQPYHGFEIGHTGNIIGCFIPGTTGGLEPLNNTPANQFLFMVRQ
jgi:hypothetical protein